VFSVQVQGATVVDHLDIFAEVGYQTPLVKEVTVAVDAAAVLAGGVSVRFVSLQGPQEGPAVYGMSLAVVNTV
jgi:hypothetical protein